ncbi:MAG: DsrE family protein [Alphaproteobacteria bacterium]|nr:DsrE family protein [Alphaproteobacteria bacterium]
MLAGLVSPALADDSDFGIHKLALQISDDDPRKMTAVLNVAANVSRHYASIGEEVEITIVAFNAGIHLLRTDTVPSDVGKRVRGFGQSMPNVTFVACGNTLDTMERAEGQRPPLFENAEVQQAGVVTLIELHEAGYTVVRP